MTQKTTTKKKKEEKKKLSEKEFENEVVKLAKTGVTAEKIGEALRKKGIHPKQHKKKISLILKEHNCYENPDVKNIEQKLERIKAHFAKNKQDKRAMREKDRVFSQLRKIKTYHKLPLK